MKKYSSALIALWVFTLVMACVCGALAVDLFDISRALYPENGPTLFEDGSFIIGQWSGCLPTILGGICN